MRLARVMLDRSPLSPGRLRLTGDVEYQAHERPAESIWFDVDEGIAGGLSDSGNPWLACLLPLAVSLGESLELCRPVDPMLREGAEAVMQVWDGWYPGRATPIAIECDLLPPRTPDRLGRTGSFFSGGVDSFHTLLRHQPYGGAFMKYPIDDLLTVWGFDVPLSAPAAFHRLADGIARIAALAGTTSVTLATNLRESGWRSTNWGLMGQGPALAAVALALEGRFSRMMLPSSLSYSTVLRWGTHPLLDPLFSTTATTIHNDGAVELRQEKIEALSRWELAMSHLRVCWADQSDQNCGRCEKCLRTLTGFELIGTRDRCVSFPQDTWSLDALASLRYRNHLDRRHMARMAGQAALLGRHDVATAINRAVRRYDMRVAAVRIGRWLRLRGTGGPA